MSETRRRGWIAVAGLAAALVVVGAVRWVFDAGTDADDPADGRADGPRLSVQTLAPADGLAEAVVTVGGFTPESRVAVLLCGRSAHLAQRDTAPLTARCDTGTMSFARTDAGGALELALSIPRRLRIGTDVLDCAEPEQCLIRVVSIDSPEEDETIELSFEAGPSAASPPTAAPPLLAVEPAEVGHGATVTVTGSGLGALDYPRIVQCVLADPASWAHCDTPTIWTDVTIDADGTLSAEVTVSRYIGTSRGWHDCAQLDTGACVLLLADRPTAGERGETAPEAPERMPTAVPLSFDRDEPPPPVDANVIPSSGIADGTAVTVELDIVHIRWAHGNPRLAICAAARSACAELDPFVYTSGVTVWLSVAVPRRFTAFVSGSSETVDCVDEPCVIRLVIPAADDRRADFGIAFDPAAALRPAPDDSDAALARTANAVLRPGRDLRNAETVQLHVRDAPSGELTVELCHADALGCVTLAEAQATSGEAVVEFAVPRVIAPEGRALDCAPRRCRLQVVGDDGPVAVLPVGFEIGSGQ